MIKQILTTSLSHPMAPWEYRMLSRIKHSILSPQCIKLVHFMYFCKINKIENFLHLFSKNYNFTKHICLATITEFSLKYYIHTYKHLLNLVCIKKNVQINFNDNKSSLHTQKIKQNPAYFFSLTLKIKQQSIKKIFLKELRQYTLVKLDV